MTEADKVKQFRIKHKLTQRQLAEMVGVTTTTISRWERGEVTATGITFSRIEKMLEAEMQK